jgi:hypothetical protein
MFRQEQQYFILWSTYDEGAGYITTGVNRTSEYMTVTYMERINLTKINKI